MSPSALTILCAVYGVLTGYVLARATRNRQRRRANSALVEHLGWLLCGVSLAIAVVLFGWAVLLAAGSAAVPVPT